MRFSGAILWTIFSGGDSLTKKIKVPSRFEHARRWLIFWTLFIGVGAVCGAAGMLIDPTGKAMGMDSMLPHFEKLPFSEILFQDYVFSGISLLIVNGISNLTAAALLFFRKKSGIILGAVFGVTLMLWICIQFYMFPFNFMSTIYFIFGAAQAATGYAAWIFKKQESFIVDSADYPDIGKNPALLVVFFSRLGYVKQKAFEEANRTGAKIYEIKSTERTEGTLGFWWCGRFGMHRWAMPIEDISVDLSSFEHITICSPIWVFSLAAPVRAFCAAAAGKIKSADYILVHHTGGRYENAAAEMDKLLKTEHTCLKSYKCHTGKFKEIK